MDKLPAIAEADLLPVALEAARGLGLVAVAELVPPGRAELAVDAVVCLGLADKGQRYVLEVKRHLRPANLGAALHKLDRQADLHGLPGLLVADYITPDMAETLRQQGRAFLDAAGNAYVRQAAALVWVTGRKPVAKTMALPVGRAFQPTGLQVLFALVCHPEWVNLPYRELAARAGVAHGTVGWVMPDLQQQGFVTEVKGKRGTRRLYETERLLALWVDAYARQLRPRTLLGRYYVPTLEGWQGWPLAAHQAQWGGEPAAALLTHYQAGRAHALCRQAARPASWQIQICKGARCGATGRRRCSPPLLAFPGWRWRGLRADGAGLCRFVGDRRCTLPGNSQTAV
jgi:hypothetical protein